MPSPRSLMIALCCAVLLIASAAAAMSETPPPLPTPVGDYTVYTVQHGDTLSVIAARFGVSIRAIVRANRIFNADFINVGQELYIPSVDQALIDATAEAARTQATVIPADGKPTQSGADLSATPGGDSAATPSGDVSTPIPAGDATQSSESLDGTALALTSEPTFDAQSAASPEPTLEPTPIPTATVFVPPPPMEFGVELYPAADTVASDAAVLTAFGAQWVKLYADWGELEAVPGVIDYANLDSVVELMEARGLKIILTVTNAPNWARTSQDENGPPDDLTMFSDFLTELAGHYVGRVATYEIWNEPNLRREWNSSVHPIGAFSYAQMLQSAYSAVKTADPAALVISAGLAPTGIDDDFNAVNDRRFLTELLQVGLTTFADGIGVHPFGFGNPPDVLCCDAAEGVETHTGDPSFYFWSMLNTYRDMAAATSPVLPLWVTAFGWGVADPAGEVARNTIYVTYNTPDEQAAFTISALTAAKDLGIVRVMILSNLNGCTVQTENAEVCYLSINAPGSAQRPLFEALRQRAVDQAASGG